MTLQGFIGGCEAVNITSPSTNDVTSNHYLIRAHLNFRNPHFELKRFFDRSDL